MTVIAWRSGVMACDSCWTYGDTQVASMCKIIRLSSGALLGQAGDNDARALVALLDKVKVPDKLPTRAELEATKVTFIGLIAFPRGGVYCVSSGPVGVSGWQEEENKDDDYGVWPATSMGGYAAVGSGSEAALSAMDAGATAKQAAEIACRRNINCRTPVHVFRLLEKPKARR